MCLFYSCGSENSDEDSRCNSSTFQSDVNTKTSADYYIVDITETAEYYKVFFDDGSNLEICKALLSSYTFDNSNWEVSFDFSDGTSFISDAKGEISTGFVLDPFGRNPVCAMANIYAKRAGKIGITVKGKYGAESDLSHQFEALDTVFNTPIFGLYQDYANEVEIRFTSSEGILIDTDTLIIQTEKISRIDPEINIKTVNRALMEPGEFHLVSSLSYWSPNIAYMFDTYGEIRWMVDYTNSDILNNLLFDVGVEQLQNGNLYFGDKWTSTIYEIDFFGTIVDSWPLIGHTFHHNVVEKPNGNFLVTTNRPGSTHNNGKNTKEDFVVEIDRNTKEIIKAWDFKLILDENREVLGPWLSENPVDWIHINAIVYSESDHTIIVSGRHQGIIKVDYNDNMQWILAPHKDWGNNRQNQDCNAFLLTAVNAQNEAFDEDVQLGNKNAPDFEWPWYQHAPELLPNGNLLVFDNGTKRNFGSTTQSYSRAVEYKINGVDKTVQQIWQYGSERGLECYAEVLSDVDYLPITGNVLFCPGMRVYNGSDFRGGRIIELDYTTKEVVFEAYINSSGLTFHRAERMSLY